MFYSNAESYVACARKERRHSVSSRVCQGIKESRLIDQARVWRPMRGCPPHAFFAARRTRESDSDAQQVSGQVIEHREDYAPDDRCPTLVPYGDCEIGKRP